MENEGNCFKKLLLLDRAGHHAADDLLLKHDGEDQDGRHAQQQPGHDGAVIGGLGPIEAVSGQGQGQQLLVRQHKGGEQEVIPER